MISFKMSEEQRGYIHSVRQLAQQEIAPLALQMDEDSENFNWHYINILARENLIAPIIPVEFGGRGLDYLTIAMIV